MRLDRVGGRGTGRELEVNAKRDSMLTQFKAQTPRAGEKHDKRKRTRRGNDDDDEDDEAFHRLTRRLGSGQGGGMGELS